MCFTNFVPDPEIRNKLGLYYIGLSASMISAHLSLLVVASIMACKHKQKMKKLNRIKKEQQAKIKAKEEAEALRQSQLKITIKNTPLDVIEEDESEDSSIESQQISEEKSLDISEEFEENEIVEEP